jgi:DNA-binding transcriptional MerR regulator
MTTTDERRVIRRRPREGSGRRRSFHAPDVTWMRALKSCQDRGITLGSQLVRALERIAAGETL